MGMISARLTRKGNKYEPGRCVRGCGGSYRFSSRSRLYFCVSCGGSVPPLPRGIDATNVDDVRWDGSKWIILKQKKIKKGKQ